MIRNKDLLNEIKSKTALEARKLKLYPDHLIDPVVLPINNTTKVSIYSEHRFNMNMIICNQGLPYGIYARLIIAYFTHFERFKYIEGKTFDYRVANSTSELFTKITGGKITTETQTTFLEQLEKINTCYFSNKKTKNANYFTKLIGYIEKRGRAYYYYPNGIYEDKLASYTPIDIRVLQLCRLERQRFAPDLYIYLTKKLKYLKNDKIELDLHLMRNQILYIHADKDEKNFKKELKNALEFLKEIFVEFNFEVKSNTVILNQYQFIPSK